MVSCLLQNTDNRLSLSGRSRDVCFSQGLVFQHKVTPVKHLSVTFEILNYDFPVEKERKTVLCQLYYIAAVVQSCAQ